MARHQRFLEILVFAIGRLVGSLLGRLVLGSHKLWIINKPILIVVVRVQNRVYQCRQLVVRKDLILVGRLVLIFAFLQGFFEQWKQETSNRLMIMQCRKICLKVLALSKTSIPLQVTLVPGIPISSFQNLIMASESLLSYSWQPLWQKVIFDFFFQKLFTLQNNRTMEQHIPTECHTSQQLGGN